VEKTYCDKVTEANKGKCEDATTSDDSKKKCIYDGTSCTEKTKCEEEENPSPSTCSEATTSDNSKKKCIFNEIEVRCKEKTLCDKVDEPSKSTCSSATTSDNETKTKCFFKAKDNTDPTDKCVTKEICSQVNNPGEDTCADATTLNPKTKCTFESGGSRCSISNKQCSEITEDASNEICETIIMEGDNGCKYDSTNEKCVESPKCLKVGTITDDAQCTSAPTSDYIIKKCIVKVVNGTKSCSEESKTCSEIKNGANAKICIDAPV